MNLGPAEVAVILLVALLVFGPARLPEISRQVGSAMRELRRMQSSLRHELDNAMREPAEPTTTPTTPPAAVEPDHTDVTPDPGQTAPPDDGFAGPRDSFL